MESSREPKRLLWPEIAVGCCWAALFLVGDFVFRDDESLGHRATHVALWLSVVCYLAVALVEYRSSEP